MNKSIIAVAGLVAIAMLLNACGAYQLRADDKARINTADIQLTIKQNELYGGTSVTMGDINISIGGLDNNTSAKREKAERNNKDIQPILKALKGFNVNELARKSYETGFRKVSWMKPATLTTVKKEIEQVERFQITLNSKSDAVIFIDFDYHLDNSFRKFILKTKTQMFSRLNRNTDGQPLIVFRNKHFFDWKHPELEGVYERQDIIKKWTENGADKLREKIRQAIEEDVKRLIEQLEK